MKCPVTRLNKKIEVLIDLELRIYVKLRMQLAHFQKIIWLIRIAVLKSIKLSITHNYNSVNGFL